MNYAGYLASAAMGMILGLMGGGGSILTVPILVYFFTLSPTMASGYSLFVVGITALVGSVISIRKKDIDFSTGIIFAIPSILGVHVARGMIIPIIPGTLLQVGSLTLTKEILVMAIFALVMVAASYSMIKNKPSQKQMQMQQRMRIAIMGIQGFIVGLVAGFVGAGGGFLIIPALIFMGGLTMKVAVGTSLMIITLQSLFGFSGDILRGLQVDWSLLGVVTIFAIFGIILGFSVAHKIKEQKLKMAFGWFVFTMGFAILLQQFLNISSK